MSERPLFNPLPRQIIQLQQQAANPQSSIWVEANAGSGKTRVLTDRVLRLLLAGVKPDQILCLTYTKAAAAEMRQRVSARLADWALADHAHLDKELFELLDSAPDTALLERARTLFATALETPGGLKIQTIHAFCESVLHRFPVEAGVPFDFKVVDDYERETMILEARERIIARGINGDPALSGPVETLFDTLSDFAIAAAIDLALNENRKLKQVLADRDGAKQRLRRLARYEQGASSGHIRLTIETETLLLPGDLRRVVELAGGQLQGNRFADRVARGNLDRPTQDDLVVAFLTDQGEPRKSLVTKALADAHPALFARLEAERDRVHQLSGEVARALLIERSEALLDVLGAISDAYEAQKRARSLLDFDDLVARLSRLLQDDAQGPWVRYKLDGGLSHILVDESQDTNPEQWQVIDALVSEFFEPGGIDKPRTLFAVGDGKQSIYSFQGAEPELFRASGERYRHRAGLAQRPFAKVRLRTSFRTLMGVLSAVDVVFRNEERQRAVLEELTIEHSTARRDEGGTVTLWPPVREAEDEVDATQWPLDVPRDLRSAARQVAERIAAEIATWVRERRPLGARGRAIRPDDVLILVQSRSSLFHEIIRALHRFKLQTPGADRLAVTGHIAVLDLLALGDVLLNTGDDLQLAALLRSPLFGLSEDELYALAEPREGKLWPALAASREPLAAAAYTQLHSWRSRLDFERPFEFFAQVLQAEGGLRRFHERMGPEVDDVFAEFLELALAHEQSAQPSLQGFLGAMRTRDVMIKRELNERGGGVRVMTVHGAKGLEAPIVILADAASKPDGRQTSRPVYLPLTDPGPLLLHASSKADHVPETMALRDAEAARQQAEYWRKLYVAMTRAEDELYVTGMLTKQAKLDGTWYEAIELALRPMSTSLKNSAGEETALLYPAERVNAKAALSADTVLPPRMPAVDLPPLPRPHLIRVIRPSLAGGDAAPERVLDSAADAVRDAEGARQEGLALHALLQHLPRIESAQREAVAHKAVVALLPDRPDRHAALANKALSILGRPELQTLFGPDSRAEVPFLTEARRSGELVRLAGRIDRLVVTAERVLVVDFKSDADPARDLAGVRPAYLTQLGLYALVAGQLFPQRQVETAILWTSLESLLKLPGAALTEAVRGFTIK
jgi:ATP-dependent helicase/nuclease subunit A